MLITTTTKVIRLVHSALAFTTVKLYLLRVTELHVSSHLSVLLSQALAHFSQMHHDRVTSVTHMRF